MDIRGWAKSCPLVTCVTRLNQVGILRSAAHLLFWLSAVVFKVLGKLKLSPLKQQTIALFSSDRNRDCSLLRAIALSSITSACTIIIAQLGLLQSAELKAFDLLTQLTAQPVNIIQPPKTQSARAAASATDQRIVIISITEEDIQAQNQWPLSDQIFADLLSQLQQQNPAVIGLDIYRDIPHEPGTQALAKQLQKDNVITISKLDDIGQVGIPSPLQVPEDQVGFADLVVDPDSRIRRHFLFAALDTQEFYSLSLRLAQKFLAQQGLDTYAEPDAIVTGNNRIEPIQSNTGGYQNIGTGGYQTLIRYSPPSTVAQQISLSQVLSGDFDPNSIADKIVIIGTTAPSQKDLFYTPFSANNQGDMFTAGVVIHAQLTSQLLSAALDDRALLSALPQWSEFFGVVLCGISGGLIIWRFSRPHIIAALTFAGITGISAIAGLLFAGGVWIPLALPLVTFLSTGASLSVYKEFRKTFYDSITGLPNRALFTQELQKRLKRQPEQPATIILLDIDGFKLFNESFGLRSGDLLLQSMAKRLKQNLPAAAKPARIAGDEFVVLLKLDTRNPSDKTVKEQVIATAKWLSQSLSQPLNINGQKVFPSVTTGIAISDRASIGTKNCLDKKDCLDTQKRTSAKQPFLAQLTCPAIDAEDLLRDAQTAISRAKSKGRGRCEVFSPDMRVRLSNRIWIEADLREALKQKNLLLYYQPLVCLKTMRLAGFEALIRWQHPTRGMISPGEFIPVAEDTGLIIPIGQWVLEVACAQAQRWRKQFPDFPPFISVNLSGRQFSQQDLVQQIDRILTETQLERSALKLELTESVVMDDVEASIDILLQLKSLQLQLGIDDFGTGYSSLSYLHRFPIDTLKVDRSFVMEMESPSGTAELVKTIIALGHNLGMNVVAEGIETESQARRLQALQCEYGQGYLFAKPLPTQAAEDLLSHPINWDKYM